MIAVPWIASGRPRQIETRSAGRELMRRELAHENAARRAQFLRDDGVSRSDVVLQYLRVRGGRQAGVIDDVLETVGHAVQRSAPVAARDLRLSRARIFHRDVRGETQERIELRIVLFDP